MSTPKYYPTIDNGGIPFVVKVAENEVTVFDVGIEYSQQGILFFYLFEVKNKLKQIFIYFI
jgi:hypothetical protein